MILWSNKKHSLTININMICNKKNANSNTCIQTELHVFTYYFDWKYDVEFHLRTDWSCRSDGNNLSRGLQLYN